MNNSMVEALRRRRGKGVDISIVLGEQPEIKSQMHGDSETEGEVVEIDNENADDDVV